MKWKWVSSLYLSFLKLLEKKDFLNERKEMEIFRHFSIEIFERNKPANTFKLIMLFLFFSWTSETKEIIKMKEKSLKLIS